MRGVSLQLVASVAFISYCNVSAWAQEAPADSAQESEAAPSTGSGIQDIVVTAQRRAENVQRSSLAINVVGADEINRVGVNQAKDLVSMVPGLQIASGGNTAQTFIRGVGDFSSTALGQSAVAYNVDGVYVTDTASIFPQFYDIQRIEVLKGPQGTLYGRNSSGGAINIITNRPNVNRVEGNASVEFGNYDMVRATGAVNLPLSGQFAARAAFNYITRDGYLSDGTDDDSQRAGRLQLLYDNGDGFSLLINGDIAHRGGKGPGATVQPRAAGNGKFVGAVDAANNAYLQANSFLPPFLIYTPGAGLPPTAPSGLKRDMYVDNTQRNISAEINYDLGGVTATFVPAYRYSSNHIGSYIASIPFINDETTRQQSYEFRLSHNSDRIKAVAGIFYFDLDQFSHYISYTSLIPGLTADSKNNLDTKSIAGFGQVTFSLTDSFRLIAGGRYTHESRKIDGFRMPVTGGDQVDYTGDTDFNNFSFRGGLEYDLGPLNMLYATVSRGFKSGGFNTFQGMADQPNYYRPEKLYSYTAGLRNRFLDNRVQLNVEGFYWDYKGSQQTHFAYDPTGTLQFMTFNAATATMYGFDVDLTVKPTPADTLSFVVEYLHTKFNDFKYDIPTVQYRPGSTGCPVAIEGSFTTIDCSGFVLPRSPKWSGTASYQHEFSLANGAAIVAGGDINFATRRYTAVDYVEAQNVKGFMRGNAFVTFNTADDVFSVTGFIKNIGNAEVPIGGIEAPFAPGLVYSTVDAPRTYGVRFQAKF